jgi:hypothetical protein
MDILRSSSRCLKQENGFLRRNTGPVIMRIRQKHRRAEQERQRAESLAARLRALGVDEE